MLHQYSIFKIWFVSVTKSTTIYCSHFVMHVYYYYYYYCAFFLNFVMNFTFW